MALNKLEITGRDEFVTVLNYNSKAQRMVAIDKRSFKMPYTQHDLDTGHVRMFGG